MKFINYITSFLSGIGHEFIKTAMIVFKKLPTQIRLGFIGIIFTILTVSLINTVNNKPASSSLKFKSQLFGPWDYTVLASQGDLKTSLGVDEKNLKMQVSKGESSVTFASPLNNPTVQQTDDENVVVYQTSNKLVSVKYRPLPEGIKEEIILAADPQTTTFVSKITLQNTEPRLTPDGQIVFVNPQGEYQFHIQQPWAEDASGDVTYGLKYRLIEKENDQSDAESASQKVSQYEQSYLNISANETTLNVSRQLLGPIADEQAALTPLKEYYLILEIDPTWLQNPQRQYPVIIDPTVVHDESSEFSGEFDRAQDTGASSYPSIETYYHELPADEHTVGLWHMNNDWDDDSGNSHNGTAEGHATFSTSSFLGSHAGYFDGLGDGTSITDHDDFTFGNGSTDTPFSIEAWVYMEDATENMIVTKRDDTTGSTQREWDLFTNSSNVLSFAIWDNSAGVVYIGRQYNKSFPEDSWHHVAATYDGSRTTKGISLYLDGKKVDDTDLTAGSYVAMENKSSDVCIGCYFNSGGNPDWSMYGQIDEVRLSNISRTPEEIKAAAQRRPYSIYTSDVIDLTYVASWNSLSWDEWGVATGDGETLKDSTSLIAQWNLNETSGTTANNDAEGSSCGGTPANCDGTLTNMTTSGQDATPGDGWTADNNRWGGGALMFDGTDGHIIINDTDALSVGNGSSDNPMTICSWVKMDKVDDFWIYSKGDPTYREYEFGISGANTIYWALYDNNSTNRIYAQSVETLNHDLGKWTHYCATYDGSSTDTGLQLYRNGVEIATTLTTQGTYVAMHNQTIQAVIGRQRYNNGSYTNGVIDSLSFFSRELPATEILSNYNTSNIEFQTRVGDDTSPDDGDWDAWSSTTGETAIEDFDELSPIQKISQTNLISHWKLDETSGTRYDETTNCGGSGCDLTDNNTVTSNPGRLDTAADFEKDNTEYLSKTDHADLSAGDIDFTITAWIKPESNVTNWFMGKSNSVATDYEWGLERNTGNTIKFIVYDGSSTGSVQGSGQGGEVGKWTFIVAWHDATANTINVQMNNGVINSTSWTTGSQDTSHGFSIGSLGEYIGANARFDGLIDEVSFWKRTLTATEKTQLYLDGVSSLTQGISQQADTAIYYESSGAEKITAGASQVDGNTVALWHLDETNGDNAGDDIFDETSNDHDGEIYGSNLATSITDGIHNKARNFNGSDDAITISADSAFASSHFTWEAWVTIASDSAHGDKILYTTADAGGPSKSLLYNTVGGNYFRSEISKSSPLGNDNIYSTTVPVVGQWYHVAVTFDESDFKIYVNGILEDTDSEGGTLKSSSTKDVYIGATNSTGSNSWSGNIDEVRISNVARTPEEIAESYRSGRDHYINKTISSTDLSGKTKLPFYVAADRPGTYLQATIGESAYANYQPDANTVGLWHLDEGTDDACNAGNDDACDSSGNGNHGDISSAPVIVQGKMGKARYFDNSDDYITVSDSSSLDATNVTMEAWISPNTNGEYDTIISKTSAYSMSTSYGNIYAYIQTSSGQGLTSSGTIVTTESWNHVAVTYDGTTVKFYINGTLIDSQAHAYGGDINNSANVVWFGSNTGAYDFDGEIDEIRISNTARTADQIRQAYEIGRRTHPITIDFAASGDSGNLITGSGDYSFTVDATAYGLENKGDALYLGDKIIVREKIDDTEYIAQGMVMAVTPSTGAVTVSSWDAGSTFPSGGYTANASFFKWQREYWDLTGLMSSHRNAITNLTFRLTNGNEGRTIWLDDLKSNTNYLTTPSGSTITSSAGNQYFQYRAIISSLDEAVSATLSAVTVDYATNAVPATPSLDSPADTASGQGLTPDLKTTTTDGDSDYLQYKIELCENLAMTTNCQTFDQTSSQVGWSDQDAETETAYASGTQATYTIQSELDLGVTYYWRSYAIDPGGSNTWSTVHGTPYSFTTAVAQAGSCVVEEALDDSSLTITWTDTSSTEAGYEIQRSINGGAYSLLQDLTADSTSHEDSTVSQGNTYQYKVAPYNTGPIYGEWCFTPPSNPLDLQSGNFRFDGLNLEGVRID